jgi:membrane protein
MRAEPAGASLFQVTKASVKDFGTDQCTLRAAALSYFTVFALPPLLVLLMMVAGLVWSPESVQHALETQFGGLVGAGGATEVRQMIASGQRTSHGLIGTVLGFVGLIAGATGAFLSLQEALNAVWQVGPDPKQGGIKRFITKRLLSLGMVMGLAFLLVVSLALTAAISALGSAVGGAGIVMQIVTLIVSLGVLSVLFAAMFKFLPDATVPWRSVWTGGIVTAVLFEIGKFVIGLYLGHSKPGNPFGAASAFAVILVWIYYAGMIVLFGAEFTQHYAESRGSALRPKKGAVRIKREERIVRAQADETKPATAPDERGTGAPAMMRMGRSAEGGDISMRDQRIDIPIERAQLGHPGDGKGRTMPMAHDASMGELFKRLSADSTHLVQQEIQLAKTELQESAARAASAGGKLGIAAGLALPGILAITAAVVIVLGILIHSYWGSALIVGAAMLVAAAVLAKRAMADFKAGLAPKETVRTVREDVEWAKHETERVKHELSA